ncbi:MAG TPA: DUF5672 family protein [Steroidobacteraceae bacterium]|jgi:hypothetical protein
MLLKRLFRREMASARSIAEELERRGIFRDQIRGEHLAHVYQGMKNIVSAPEFPPIGKLLPCRLPAGSDLDRPVVGVIVETRRHPLLEFVVLNFSRTLEIPIQLFHGKSNLDFITSSAISTLMDQGKVELVQLEADSIDARKYNGLLMTRGFWGLVGSRNKILFFQTDAIACEQSDYTLSDFLSFDYIGSKWPRQRPVGLLIDGGNGGLSLRDWKKSYECLTRFPPAGWSGGEDGYFAFHIDLMGGKVGRDIDCAQFSTQYEFLYRSLGAHRIAYLDQHSRAAFLEYCKEAERLIS